MHDLLNHGPDGIPAWRELRQDALHLVPVCKLNLRTGPINEQLRHKVAGHLFEVVLEQETLVFIDPRKRFTPRCYPTGINREPLAIGQGYHIVTHLCLAAGYPIVRAVATDRIERLEGETRGIDRSVATGTGRAGAMRR